MFSVLAPTCVASAALTAGTLDDLHTLENKANPLAILWYQLMPCKVVSIDLKRTLNAETVQRVNVEIIAADGVTIDCVTAVKPRVAECNGSIHVNDVVLLPTPRQSNS